MTDKIREQSRTEQRREKRGEERRGEECGEKKSRAEGEERWIPAQRREERVKKGRAGEG